MRYLKASVKYGIAGFVVSVIAFLVFHFLDFEPLLNLNTLVLDIIIIGVFILLASKEFKDYRNNGSLRFWQGMTIGFFTYVLIALCYATAFLILCELIFPEILTEYKTQAIDFLKNSKVKNEELITEESFNERLQALKSTTSLDLTVSAFVKKVVIGMIVTPVSSIILRK